MGAWGYGVWDHDQALDIIDSVHDGLVDLMNDANDSVSMLAFLDIYMSMPHIEYDAKERLTPIIAKIREMESEQLSTWDDPEERRRIIDIYLAEVETKLKENEEHPYNTGLFEKLYERMITSCEGCCENCCGCNEENKKAED